MTDTMSDTKTCPYCAEEIKAAAIKCRYCQSDLVESPTPTPTPTPAPKPAKAPKPPKPARPPRRWPRLAVPSWLASPRLVVGLSVLAVLLAAVVGYLAWDLRRMAGTDRARESGAVAAQTDVETILSYSASGFDKGTAQAERLMTPSFRKEYADTVKLVRKDALATKSTVKAQVVARSVVSADAQRVRALLFVNQTTTGAGLQQPRVDLNRVVVTMVADGHGGWLVDRLQAL